MRKSIQEYKCLSLDDIVGDFNALLEYISELEDRIELLEVKNDK